MPYYGVVAPHPAFPLTVRVRGNALVAIEFGGGPPVGEDWERQDDHDLILDATRQLEEYFRGVRQRFEVPIDLRGTEFQKRVWNALLEIPYGETRSYARLAREVGAPGAARAVGGANHANPIPIIVPCHRVVNAGGGLGGYGGGLDRKRFLLDLESHAVEGIYREASPGVYSGR